VQLPALPPPGPDAAQVKALEDQNEKQKAANKQIEEQIAQLKERLKGDVATRKDPLGKDPTGKDPPASSNAAAEPPQQTPAGEPRRQRAAPAAGSGRSIKVLDMTVRGERRTVSPDWAAIEAQPLGSKGNPVRTYQPPGEQAYLQRLRCPDGSTPAFERQGNV